MIRIKDLDVHLKEDSTQILYSVSVNFERSKIYKIGGRNGSGKSTLLQTIMGNPSFEVKKGAIHLDDEEITSMSLTERSLKGIYLANQYPPEIEGVSLLQYLRLIYNAHNKEQQMPVFAFREKAVQLAKEIGFPIDLLKRNLGEGFSGGEKKKCEILQALVIEPEYILLDELDSGLDTKSIEEVFSGIARYKQAHENTCIVVVSHYDSVFRYLPADESYLMDSGTLLSF